MITLTKKTAKYKDTNENERKRVAFFIAIILHLLIFIVSLLVEPPESKDLSFNISFEPLKNSIPEKIRKEIEKEVKQVKKQKKFNKKSNNQSRQNSSNPNGRRKGTNSQDSFNKGFEENFMNSSSNNNTQYTSKTKKSGFNDSNDGYSTKGKNKGHGKENVKIKTGNVNQGGVHWKGQFRRRLLNRIKPSYPISLQRQSVQGNVKLLLTVDNSGRVISVRIVESSGSTKLDVLAKRAARRLRFSGSTGSDTAKAIITYKFSLSN